MAWGGWSQFDELLGGSRFDWSQFDNLLGAKKKPGFDWEALEAELGPGGRFIVSTTPDEALARVGAPAPTLPRYAPTAPRVPQPPEIEAGYPIPGKSEAATVAELAVRAGKAAATAIPETAEILQKNRERQLWNLATKALGRRLEEPEFQALLQADRERDPFYREPPEGFWTKENLAEILGMAAGFGPLGLASMAGRGTGLGARMALGAGENLMFSAPHVAATAQEHGATEALTEAGLAAGLGAALPALTGIGKLRRPRAGIEPQDPLYTPPRAAEPVGPVDHVADFQAMDEAAIARAQENVARRMAAEETLRYWKNIEEGFAAEQAAEAARGRPYMLGPGAEPEAPPAAARTVTVYQGEGAAGGAGADPRWWTTDPKRAASFGRVKAVEIPEEAVAAAQAEARRLGSGTGSDLVLPDELTRGAREVDIEADVYDLGRVDTEEPGASQPVVGARPITGEARFDPSAPDQSARPERPEVSEMKAEAEAEALVRRKSDREAVQAAQREVDTERYYGRQLELLQRDLEDAILAHVKAKNPRGHGARVAKWTTERKHQAAELRRRLLADVEAGVEPNYVPQSVRNVLKQYTEARRAAREAAPRLAEAEARLEEAMAREGRSLIASRRVAEGDVLRSVRGDTEVRIIRVLKESGEIEFEYGAQTQDGRWFPQSKPIVENAAGILRTFAKTSPEIKARVSEALRKREDALYERAEQAGLRSFIADESARLARRGEFSAAPVERLRKLEEVLDQEIRAEEAVKVEASAKAAAEAEKTAAARAEREVFPVIEVDGKTEKEMLNNLAERAEQEVRKYALLDEAGNPMKDSSGLVLWKDDVPEWTRFRLGKAMIEVKTRNLDKFIERARRPITPQTAARVVAAETKGPEKLSAEDVQKGERLPSRAFKKGEFEKAKAQGLLGETPEGYTELYGGLPLPAMWKAAKVVGKSLAKVYERVLVPFGRAVAKYGEAGRELAWRATVYRESFERMAGSAIARADRLIKPLSDFEWRQVVHALDTGAQVPEKLKLVVQELASILDEVHQRAAQLGWDIGYIKNYFPHIFERMPPEVAEALAKAGALDPRTGRQLELPSRAMSANLELSRNLHNVAGWRTDKAVIREYLLDAYEQLAQIEAFGALNAQGKFKVGNQLAHAFQLAAEMGRYGKGAEDLGLEFVTRITGQRAPDSGTQFLTGVRKLTAFASLTMSSLAQAAQVHTIPGFTGARNFLRAIKDVMTDPRRFYNRALEAGATIPALRSELAEAVGGGGIKGFMWGAPTVDQLGRVIAARSGELFAESLQKAGNTEALTELLGAAGRKYSGRLSDADLLAVGKYISDTTQLRAVTENLPAFWSSEVGKTMFQFGHFMYGMSRLHVELGKTAVRAARARDWGRFGRAVKPMVGMMIAGTVAGEMLLDVRAFLSGLGIELPSKEDLMGRPEESTNQVFDQITTRVQSATRSPNLIIRTLQNLSYAGTLGLPQYLAGRAEDVFAEQRVEQIAPSLSKLKAVAQGTEQGFKGRAKAFGRPVAKGPLGALVGATRRAFTITKLRPGGYPFPAFEVGSFKSGARKAYRGRIARRRIEEIERARGRR